MQSVMKISQRSIFDFIERTSISLQGGSLASLIQARENDSERRTNAIYGQRCLEQFEKFNHVGLWAKTFSALLIGTGDWFSTRCKLTWKLKGTKYNRLYFQLQVRTLPTNEIEFGLLPTPTCSAANGSGSKESLEKRGRGERNCLASWATLNTNGKSSQLNPRFVAEMIGFPPNWTESPFLNGETNP